jgi:uncharacterized protein YecE (DUF72 family)
MPHPIRIGIGGWTFAPWRGRFFPPGLRQADELAFAARSLATLEVNGTYYRTQKPETFAKWASAAPDGFVFALKAPRAATARHPLAAGEAAIRRFLGSGLTGLGPKLGPINWQLPPRTTFDADETAAFLNLLPDRLDGQPLCHVIEPRHPSFDCAAFREMADARGIGIVQAADGPHPRIAPGQAPCAYLRLMGTREDEAEGYPPAALDAWADRARRLAESRPVWLFLIAGHKPANPAAALALQRRLQLP